MAKPRAIRRRLLAGTLIAVAAAGGITVGIGSVRTQTGPAETVVTAASSSALPDTIRVATFNIHGGRNEAGKSDLALTAQTLRGCDFVGLQEVDGSLISEGQLQRLSKLTGLSGQFFPSERQYWHDAFGNAMLTNLPVSAWQRMPLPSLQEGSRRNVSIIKLGDRKLTILVTHLARHQDQAEQIALVSKLFLAQPAPAVLMGDLNATSADPGLQSLASAPGVTSALDLKHPELAGKHIDWILVRGMEVEDAGVMDLGASDHPLAWAELAFPR